MAIIEHLQSESKFIAKVDNFISLLEYENRGESWVIFKTFVPPELRGRGIAEELMKSASDFALVNNIKVIPTCSYAVKYYIKHPEYSNIISAEANLLNGGTCRL